MRHAILGFVLAVLVVGTARAETTPIDTSSLMNADVIVNNGGSDTSGYSDHGINGDSTQDGFGNFLPRPAYLWMTQSVVDAHTSAPSDPADRNGLPDDAFFAENSDHPAVTLNWSNSDDGNNAWTSNVNGENITFSVPGGYYYSELHLFAAIGNGKDWTAPHVPSELQITLTYTDGTTDVTSWDVPDWYWDLSTATTGTYYLVDGRDRFNGLSGGAYENHDTAAIFGLDVGPDVTKQLSSVKVLIADNPGYDPVDGFEGHSRVNFYGAVGKGEVVPEPSTLLLALVALGVVGGWRKWGR